MSAAAVSLADELAQALREERVGWHRPRLLDAVLMLSVLALVPLRSPQAWPLTLGLLLGHVATDGLCGLLGRRRRTAIELLLGAILMGAALGWAVEQWLAQTMSTSDRVTRAWLHISFGAVMISLPLWQGLRRLRALRRLEEERSLLRAELQALQAQIEPHFLFNTLATLRSFVRQGSDRALPLLDAVSGLLEASLDRLRRPDGATLGQEIQLVEHYLAIMAMRLGERLQWRIDVPAELHHLPLPPLMLQPLVENAIQHGIEPSEHGGEVVLQAMRDGRRLRLSVVNSGRPLRLAAEPIGHGLALTNLCERLRALHGDQAQLALATNAAGLTEATLTLPLA